MRWLFLAVIGEYFLLAVMLDFWPGFMARFQGFEVMLAVIQ